SGSDTTIGRVEEGRGTGAYWQPTRFPSPLIKPDVPISSIRLSGRLHQLAHGSRHRQQPMHSQFSVYNLAGKLDGAQRRHLMAPLEEVPHTLINVVVDCSILRKDRTTTFLLALDRK